MFTLFFGPEGETHELVTTWTPPNLSRSALIAQAVISMDPTSSSNKGPGAVRLIKKGAGLTLQRPLAPALCRCLWALPSSDGLKPRFWVLSWGSWVRQHMKLVLRLFWRWPC